MKGPLLCRSEHSHLVVVDVQERLAGAMDEARREQVIRNSGILLHAATTLDVPTTVTEQYPRGLGHTVAALRDQLASGAGPLEKSCFSCTRAEGFGERLRESNRSQLILAGMESHVCVLQTAMDLLSGGHQVFVVADAVCSRDPANHDNALARLRQAGCIVTNTESVLFEWLREASHPHFKEISALIK